VDNWATCDQMSIKVFGKHKYALPREIEGWLASGHVYVVRFAIGLLMSLYLKEDFRQEYMDRVVGLESDEYYVNMMRAWYLATSLVYQREAALAVLEGGLLDDWTHNKAIQKAIESRRVDEEDKAYLRSLKR